MIWALFLLGLAAAAAGYLLGGRLFVRAIESGDPEEAPPSGGCCGFSLPVPPEAGESQTRGVDR